MKRVWPIAVIFCFFAVAGRAQAPAKAAKPLAAVPFIFNGYQVLIPVVLDGGKDTLHFLFDTGCEVNILSRDKAEQLGLTGREAAGISGWSKGVLMIPKATAQVLKIGGLSLPYPEFYLQDFGRVKLGETAIDGVIGYDLLRRYAIEIDFSQKTMRFFKSAGMHYPPGGEKLVLGLNYKTPTLQATITLPGGSILSSTYHLITGGDFGLLFNDEYVKKYALDRKLTVTGSETRQDLAGPVIYSVCRVPLLVLDRYRNADVPALYSVKINDGAPGAELAGAIGARVWKEYTLFINLPQRALYLLPANR